MKILLFLNLLLEIISGVLGFSDGIQFQPRVTTSQLPRPESRSFFRTANRQNVAKFIFLKHLMELNCLKDVHAQSRVKSNSLMGQTITPLKMPIFRKQGSNLKNATEYQQRLRANQRDSEALKGKLNFEGNVRIIVIPSPPFPLSHYSHPPSFRQGYPLSLSRSSTSASNTPTPTSLSSSSSTSRSPFLTPPLPFSNIKENSNSSAALTPATTNTSTFEPEYYDVLGIKNTKEKESIKDQKAQENFKNANLSSLKRPLKKQESIYTKEHIDRPYFDQSKSERVLETENVLGKIELENSRDKDAVLPLKNNLSVDTVFSQHPQHTFKTEPTTASLHTKSPFYQMMRPYSIQPYKVEEVTEEKITVELNNKREVDNLNDGEKGSYIVNEPQKIPENSLKVLNNSINTILKSLMEPKVNIIPKPLERTETVSGNWGLQNKFKNETVKEGYGNLTFLPTYSSLHSPKLFKQEVKKESANSSGILPISSNPGKNLLIFSYTTLKNKEEGKNYNIPSTPSMETAFKEIQTWTQEMKKHDQTSFTDPYDTHSNLNITKQISKPVPRVHEVTFEEYNKYINSSSVFKSSTKETKEIETQPNHQSTDSLKVTPHPLEEDGRDTNSLDFIKNNTNLQNRYRQPVTTTNTDPEEDTGKTPALIQRSRQMVIQTNGNGDRKAGEILFSLNDTVENDKHLSFTKDLFQETNEPKEIQTSLTPPVSLKNQENLTTGRAQNITPAYTTVASFENEPKVDSSHPLRAGTEKYTKYDIETQHNTSPTNLVKGFFTSELSISTTLHPISDLPQSKEGKIILHTAENFEDNLTSKSSIVFKIDNQTRSQLRNNHSTNSHETEGTTPSVKEFRTDSKTFDSFTTTTKPETETDFAQESNWKNIRKMHLGQESQKNINSNRAAYNLERDQRRSDILISDTIEDYAQNESQDKTLKYLERFKQNLSDPDFPADFNSNLTIPLIPTIISHLWDDKISSEDSLVLSEVFGRNWPYIVALSNNTSLDLLPLLKMKDEKDWENVLKSYFLKDSTLTTTEVAKTEGNSKANLPDTYDYMEEYKDMFQDILSEEFDEEEKATLKETRRMI